MILEYPGARPTIDPIASTVLAPAELMRRQSAAFGAHRDDRECG